MDQLHVSYDPAARATYVQVAVGKTAATRSVSDLVMVDVNEFGEPVGVEFLVMPDRVTPAMVEAVAARFPTLSLLKDLDLWVFGRKQGSLPRVLGRA